MGEYNVAFTGVFDLENYGDLLFPEVFKEAMKKRGLNYSLFLFSPIGGKKALDQSQTVYPISALEDMTIDKQIKTIIVGGGALVHFNKIYQKFPGGNEFLEYKIYETWVRPSLIKEKLPVNIIWNAPDVPFSIPSELRQSAQSLVSNVDYLAVRNETAKKNLCDCAVKSENITVVPDTVLTIADYFTSHPPSGLINGIFLFKRKYVVFHCNRHISEQEMDFVIPALKRIKKMGYEVVLLPIAYTHKDEEILRKINDSADGAFHLITKKLNINQMMDILANCELYIGISFHGVITSIGFQKKAIGYNYLGYEKTVQLFNQLNLEKYCISSASNILPLAEELLSSTINTNLQQLKDCIEKHFDRVVSIIENQDHAEQKMLEPNFANQHIETLVTLADLSQKNKYLEKQVDWYKNDNDDLRKRLQQAISYPTNR